MSTIILRIPAKRHRGASKSGKAEVFLTSGYGGDFFAIPKWAIEGIRHYDKPINEAYAEMMMEVKFSSTAMTGQHPLSVDLNAAINKLSKQPNTIIR